MGYWLTDAVALMQVPVVQFARKYACTSCLDHGEGRIQGYAYVVSITPAGCDPMHLEVSLVRLITSAGCLLVDLSFGER